MRQDVLSPSFTFPFSSPIEQTLEHPYGPLVEYKLPFPGTPAFGPAEATFAASKGHPTSADTLLRAASPAPTVTIKDGTVVGNSDTGVEAFKGILFAEPLLGSLRLKPPIPLIKTFGRIIAIAIPKGCP